MKRRQILITAAASLALAPGAALFLGMTGARADEAPISETDRILGSPEAPITIIEYASLTCPHCASFHAETLPAIKKNWIETGKARLVYRDFPLDGLALRAAALASCVEGERYFNFLDTLFRGQQSWARAQDPLGALAKIARLAGMNQETFDSCIGDNATLDRILQQRVEATQAFDIKSTPSFIVNGKKVEGARTTQQFEQVLEAADPKS